MRGVAVITRGAFAALIAMAACGGTERNTIRLPDKQPDTEKNDEPPVALNADPPVEYPRALFEQGIEGKVILRLYVDEHGTVVNDSTRIEESSGYPALDSAAVTAAPQFKFAPALRDGEPIATAFLQPVHFRHPQHASVTP